jgi:aspartate/methionine/tyrosine aminotransferase
MNKQSLNERFDYLKAMKHPYFPEGNRVEVEIENYDQIGFEAVELALTSSYDDFCFDERITATAQRQTFASILELSSGNNDLGFFKSMYLACCNASEACGFHLCNYSGGRGDYFSLKKIAAIEGQILSKLTGITTTMGIDNVCVTYGGQGAYSGLGHFFSLPEFIDKSILFFDSAYCQNSKPFTRRGLRVEFMATEATTHLPPVDSIIKRIEQGDIAALYYVKYHNPSGEHFDDASIAKLLKALKKHNVFLIYAEAYESLGFSVDSQERYLSLPCLAQKHDYKQLIRVKTLSKERGFAGLRASYVLAPKEIVRFLLKYNDEVGYNPPMANSKLLVLNAYFSMLDVGLPRDNDLEHWLNLPVDIGLLFSQYQADCREQSTALFDNISMIATKLFGVSITVSDVDRYLSNEHFAMKVPAGGINCSIELKCLSGFDEIDMFRKIYLETGLIFHTSKFMFKKQGCWLRITLSHSKARIERSLDELLRIIAEQDTFNFLPIGTLRFSFRSPERSALSSSKELSPSMMPMGLTTTFGKVDNDIRYRGREDNAEVPAISPMPFG